MPLTLAGTHKRIRAAITVLLLAACATPPAGTDGSPSPGPYAGLEEREVKALAPEQISDLLAGRGAGYALAAELNHYPGPSHALELADELELNEEQRDAITTIKAEMQEDAQQLGAELVEAEAELDAAFASREIDEGRLQSLTAAAAEIEGRLRATHLAAHIETRELLTPAQVAEYDELRGYREPTGSEPAHEGHQGGERDD